MGRLPELNQQETFVSNDADSPTNKHRDVEAVESARPPSTAKDLLRWKLVIGSLVAFAIILSILFGILFNVQIDGLTRASSSEKDESVAQASDSPTYVPSNAPTFVTFTTDPTSNPSSQPSLAPTSLPTSIFQATTFCAIGDVPYNTGQAQQLVQHMTNLPAECEFVIHVGDIRAARQGLACRPSDYTSVASTLRLSHAPVFMVLGDNEWNDCSNPATGLALWKEEFLDFESRYWNHSFGIGKQPGREDNFVFVHKKILFLGLNLVGGDVLDQQEWNSRLTDQLQWTMTLIRIYRNTYPDYVGRVVIFGHANPRNEHNVFFLPLRDFIRNELNNGIPILYVNGDLHRWLHQPSFLGEPSFLRVMLEGGLDAPVRITVNWDGNYAPTNQAFVVNRTL